MCHLWYDFNLKMYVLVRVNCSFEVMLLTYLHPRCSLFKQIVPLLYTPQNPPILKYYYIMQLSVEVH